jgi:hypothetical protein
MAKDRKYMTNEDIQNKIENEGFDYFFRFYSSPMDFKDKHLREAVERYTAAADDLLAELRNVGVEL